MASEWTFEANLKFAGNLDEQDPLRFFRDRFCFPVGSDGRAENYLVGNSLGLQPRNTEAFILQELEKWRTLGVRGHFQSDHPWMPYHEFLAPTMAELVGANQDEVVVMNSLTTNLHLMMASFYRPTDKRHKILIEEHAFPSDHYAIESQIRFHGRRPDESMLLARPRPNEECLRTEDLLQLIDEQQETLSLILLPGVQYYTGQFLDLEAITRKGHECGITVGFDLAHAVGNVPLQLHDWQVDFAVWCTYKYLNSGPGSVGGCFVHQRHFGRTDLPRLAGWWGHDKSTRFLMKNEFHVIPTAEGWQLSNPPILSLAAIRASLEVFADAGGIKHLREKSLRLTGYLEWLLHQKLGEQVRVLTPGDHAARGCQLSLEVKHAGDTGKRIHQQLEERNIATDWREPNVIRVAPVPLYNSFVDVYHFVESLEQILDES